jgi:hypothetical protein
MSDTDEHRKDSELQAAVGPPDPELESLIAPQGYDPTLVDDIATMESPAQQRRQGIRFLIIMLLVLAIGFWFCTPADLVVPSNWADSAPYGLDERPSVPSDKFLKEIMPKTVTNASICPRRRSTCAYGSWPTSTGSGSSSRTRGALVI